MEINEQIQIANARLNVYQEIDKEEQARFIKNQPVAEDVDERNMNTRNSTRPISFPGPANPCLQPLGQSPHDYSSQKANYDTGRINHDPPLPRKSLKNSEPYQKHLYQQPPNPRIESTPRSDNCRRNHRFHKHESLSNTRANYFQGRTHWVFRLEVLFLLLL